MSERGSSVLYTRWPKPMSRSPRSTAARSHGSARSAVPISSSICERAARRAAVQRTRERADRADDRGAEVGAGRRDDARGERRRVEAVVDRGDEVLLDRGRVLGRAAPRPASCRGSSRRSARSARGAIGLEALAQPPQRADQRGHDRARRHRVVAQRRVRRCRATRGSRASRRTARPRCAARRAGRTSRPPARSRAARRRPRSGITRAGADVGRERLALGERRGQLALEQQVPDVFERARLREVDRAVLAVVVEALEAAHVADGRVGDDDAFEALRDLVRLRVGGLDHRDAHEVAHRHDADELAAPSTTGMWR